ncbi:MAG: cytochrome-c oxidase, cbb3-type subunit III, partial [Hyphomicrobiales bacterium]
MTKIEKDSLSGTEMTGHVWDGIRELDTPLPRWWVWTFYITIVWAVGYVIVYPAIPMLTDTTKGILGWSSRALVAEEILAVKTARQGTFERIANSSVTEIRDDAKLNQFALAGGRSAFAVNCSQCHGSGAQGARGFPNLNDDDWLWGGSLEAIQTSITVGIRS